MKVDGCSKITELVVAIEADEANEEIFFPKLESLDLNRLQSLTTFCSANYTFKFPSLCYLSVSACPKMKIFCRGVLSAPRLKKVRLNDQNYWDADLNTIIQQSYYETVRIHQPSHFFFLFLWVLLTFVSTDTGGLFVF